MGIPKQNASWDDGDPTIILISRTIIK